MLNGRQRAYLRSIANTLKPITHIGKDGVTEAFNTSGEMYDETGLEKTLSTIGQKDSYETCQAIINDVYAFAGDEPQSDDITLMTIKRIK